MTCELNKIRLSRFLDGELSPREKEELKAHLAQCSQCAQELAEWQAISDVFAKVKPVKPAPDYDIKFARRLQEQSAKEKNAPSVRVVPQWSLGDVLENLSRVLIPQPVLVKVAIGLIMLVGLAYLGNQFLGRDFLSVITAKGQVETYLPKQGKWQLAKTDMRLKEGALLRIGENSFLDIELSGRYKMRLKDNSELRIDKLVAKGRGAKTCLALNKGRILVDIGGGYKGKEFKVNTPSGIALAYGTEFSVDVDPKDERMWLGVLEGEVGVGSHADAPLILVKAREKTAVYPDQAPQPPLPLTAEELEILREIERIGKLLVSLVLADAPNRAREMLNSPRFYAYGKEPQEVQKILSEAVVLLNQAMRDNNRSRHMGVIAKLEEANARYKEAEFNSHLLVFIGAYYEWLSLHNEAVETFQKVLQAYPHSELASIAGCAIGIIEENRGNLRQAKEAYQKVLSLYPQSPEVAEAKEGLGRISTPG